MRLLLTILCYATLSSCIFIGLINLHSSLNRWAESKEVQAVYGYIITNSEAKIVMDYHGILSMKWSIPHKDFVFERDGEICRARAFEILKEGK